MINEKKIILLFSVTLMMFLAFCTPAGAQQKANEKTASAASQGYYKIGANDVLNIFVWKEPNLTQDVTVMPDGRITFPMIGEVMAEGRTVTDLKNIITKKLKEYLSTPEVTVIVKQSNSRVIYTIGKLNKPGPYPMAPNMTVLQALSTAGGFTEWADTKSIMIVRRKGAAETMFRFNYNEFISGKNLPQNILLRPGDTIVVP